MSALTKLGAAIAITANFAVTAPAIAQDTTAPTYDDSSSCLSIIDHRNDPESCTLQEIFCN